MAYAELAGLPAITGLYTSILCLVGYAVFGPSTDPGARPGLLARPDDRRDDPAAGRRRTAIPSGRSRSPRCSRSWSARSWSSPASAKLGFIADLISKPTMIGYMNGLALTILVGQLPKLFGFSVDADGFIDEAAASSRGVPTARRSAPRWRSALFGLAADPRRCSVALPKVPAVLVASCCRSPPPALFDLGEHGVSLVGDLPAGLPAAHPSRASGCPTSRCSWRARSASRSSRSPTRSRPRRRSPPGPARRSTGNREMIGHRRGEPRRRALPGLPGQHQRLAHRGGRAGRREDAADRAGRRGGDHADPALLAPGLLRNLPAADARRGRHRRVAVAGRHRRRRVRLYRHAPGRVLAVDRGVPRGRALGVLPGIAVAVALSIGNVFRRAWWPYQTVLGRVPGVPGYHDVRSYPHAERLPGLRHLPVRRAAVLRQRPDVPGAGPRAGARRARPRWIIVAAEPITDVDTTAADMLRDLDEELNADGVHLVFAEMKDPVRREDRPVRADADDRPGPLLPHDRGRGRQRSRPSRVRIGAPPPGTPSPAGPRDLPGAMPVGDPDDLISSVG